MANSKPKNKSDKSVKKQAKIISDASPRRVKPTPKITGSFRLLWRSIKLLCQNWKLFGVILTVYGLLTIILVRGLASNLDLKALKTVLEQIQGNASNPISNTATLFDYVVEAAISPSSHEGSVYQIVLITLMSLVFIWALKQVVAGKKIRAKDAFYSGTYPLFQFVIVLLVVIIQAIPLAIGTKLFSQVIRSGIAVGAVENIVWGLIFFLLMAWSLYLLCASVFALYIVTQPEMTPLKALRTAKQLVKRRRLTVIRKVLFLPFALLVISFAIAIPMILILTSLATWFFFVLSLLVLLVVHTYMYSLYRELL